MDSDVLEEFKNSASTAQYYAYLSTTRNTNCRVQLNSRRGNESIQRPKYDSFDKADRKR
jgi:hypothetical protein